MLEFRDIEIRDKAVFEEYTRGHSNVESCFGNLYLWRKSWHIKITYDEKAFFVLMENGVDPSFMLPPFLRNDEDCICGALEKCEEYLHTVSDSSLVFKGVTRKIKDRIERDCPGAYEYADDRGNYEYVYASEEMANLVGKKFSAKRNHINKLLSMHEFSYQAYSSDYYEQCLALQKSWIVCKGGMNEDFEDELFVMQEALNNIDALGLKGGLLFVDGKLEAFSIGERYTDDMAVIHIEKANPHIPGVFALINREFVRNEWMDVKYINREEDMGLEGLRKSKLSYQPVFMIEKFDCVRK